MGALAPSADDHLRHLDVIVKNCNANPNSNPNLNPNPNPNHNPNPNANPDPNLNHGAQGFSGFSSSPSSEVCLKVLKIEYNDCLN